MLLKKRNRRTFQPKEEDIYSLGEKVKLHAHWWFKSTSPMFDFDCN